MRMLFQERTMSSYPWTQADQTPEIDQEAEAFYELVGLAEDIYIHYYGPVNDGVFTARKMDEIYKWLQTCTIPEFDDILAGWGKIDPEVNHV